MIGVENTGRRRHRVSFLGKLILQVEWTGREWDTRLGDHKTVKEWRDAVATDVLPVTDDSP